MSIFNQLFEQAKQTPCVSKARLVAAIVYKGKIISTGCNSYKTHPLQKKFADRTDRIYLHAEIEAIARALRLRPYSILSSSDLYVVRAKMTGPSGRGIWTTGLAKPCEGCARCIASFNIRNVYYSREGDL